MLKNNPPLAILAVFVFVVLAVFADAASAANTGVSILPAQGPLQMFRDLVTGPFAWTVSVVSLVIGGSALAFGADFAGWAKAMIVLAVVLSGVVFATNMLSTWFSGALIA